MTVTFCSHYGAMLTKRKLGTGCTLHPVPRFLSSSCGTCAVVEKHTLEEIKEAAGEYLDAVYEKLEEKYIKIYEYGKKE